MNRLIERLTERLWRKGYSVTEEMGIRRINSGDELTELEFMAAAREILSEPDGSQ